VSEPTAEIADVIVDCRDVEKTAAFWSALLGRPIEGRRGPYVWLERPEGAVGVGFQRVDHAKAGKNRVHFDVSGPDVRALETRVVALGGVRAPGYGGGGFLVMADPEGNEFCVVPDEPVDVDDTGRAHYLDET
jgi:predicted enzyme related to lactoylglutathione lyase